MPPGSRRSLQSRGIPGADGRRLAPSTHGVDGMERLNQPATELAGRDLDVVRRARSGQVIAAERPAGDPEPHPVRWMQ